MYPGTVCSINTTQERTLLKPIAEAKIFSIQVGLPKTINTDETTDSTYRPWTTGFFKLPVDGRVWLGRDNLDGDGQADLHNHGGEDKAVNAYPHEHYAFWTERLGLENLNTGAFGENFTLSGLIESDVCIGDIFEIGDARIQISQPRQPCWKLSRRWHVRDLALQVQNTGHTGWYFRVLHEGFVEAGMSLRLTERPHPQWTVTLANDIMHHHTSDFEAARSLMDCRSLASRWKTTLEKRITTGTAGDNAARLYGPDISL